MSSSCLRKADWMQVKNVKKSQQSIGSGHYKKTGMNIHFLLDKLFEMFKTKCRENLQPVSFPTATPVWLKKN